MLQRQLAAALEIDTPMYSKIERSERRAKRKQAIAAAKHNCRG
jgi:transcriptional regulator with XRE-family HTH domain